MTYETKAGELARKPAMMVRLIIDQCANTHGAAPCAATGTPYCYYTYPTCKNKANYSKATVEIKLCEQEGPLIADSLPLITKTKLVPTFLDIKNYRTWRASLVVSLADDTPLALANPNKTVTNIETAGTFWKNFRARNPNYRMRFAEFYRGFADLDVSDWRLEFSGVIESLVKKKQGQWELVIRDMTARCDVDSHRAQSDENLLTQNYSGGAIIHVTDGREFDAAIHGNYSHPGYEIVKVGTQWARFSSVDVSAPNDHQLKGCAYVYGGTGIVGAGAAVVHKLVYAKDDNAAPGDSLGIPPDFIFLDLFYRAGITGERIADIDRGITLTAGISDVDTDIPVSAVNIPMEGIVRIGAELIRYHNIVGLTLKVRERGAFGTTAASHNNADPVKPTTFTDELNRWVCGVLFRRVVGKPLQIQDLIESLCASSTWMVWQSEDQLITGRPLTPPWLTDVLQSITDAENILSGSVKLDEKSNPFVTATLALIKPLTNDPGDDEEDWQAARGYIDGDLERAEFYGYRRSEQILAPFCYRGLEGDAAAARRLSILGSDQPDIIFRMDIKDALAVGELFRLTTDEIVETDGTPKIAALMMCLSRSPLDVGKDEYTARHLSVLKKFGTIAPAYPVLTANITDVQTSIQATISASTFQPDEIRAPGQFGCEDEVIDYDDFTIDDATHITFTGCVRDGDKAAHSVGALVMILYTGASDEARAKYVFISDGAAGDILDNEDNDGYRIF